MFIKSFLLLATALGIQASRLDARQTSLPPSATTVEPNFFQISPESFQGITATGAAPFLAQTNPVRFPQKTYVPNQPLQTSEPIKGAGDRNVFHLMGAFSPYFVPEEGFGVDEYPLPKGSNISQVYLVHRHGSRYPSDQETVIAFAQKLRNATARGLNFTQDLAFLNDWEYQEGVNILVAQGRQELFESGVKHYYNYGSLYRANGTKLVVRCTTVDRALKSAENFLAGYFGLDWKDYAEILPLISASGFNSSLTGTGNCPNSAKVFGNLNPEAMQKWQETYLHDKSIVLGTMAQGFNWTVSDSYNAQTLCAYETISFGYSPFCQLFDYEEWEGFSYAASMTSNILSGFGSYIGRANGAAWVAEWLARVQGHLLDIAPGLTSANLTLGTDPQTFPLHQGLYFDFGHDTSILGVLVAMGFRQFADFLPESGPPQHWQFKISNITPFAGRLNIEIIEAPHKVKANRQCGNQSPYDVKTCEARYVHFILNDRTLPLHQSFPECEYRDDGWCELSTFLKIQQSSVDKAQFQYSCEGNWTVGAYGSVIDGVPPPPITTSKVNLTEV